MLIPNKINHVIATGNLGSREVRSNFFLIFFKLIDWVETLAVSKSQVHIVRGDFDELPNLPMKKVVQVGNTRIGVIHGH